ncbi:hypothetical protein M409DRAFT_26543 [Zasmidium cellare ATCC 36951]|uniref:Uncharacterized protein n=1 Tax=Zasmidium cellare ATCC 36951 TaxID=1080233 RepID=A0A6A6CCB5_ZASCE|nr:uncharacterized protein M409DRAFT_26543 [Zasmidium cellare ATCC 36951]KAF2163096.1 hypothetical protein M409DRAFT_26543 [Zasmidium cellare ATCC 36951]
MESTEKQKSTSKMDHVLQSLEVQKQAYFDTMQKVHDLLSNNLASNSESPIRRPQGQRAGTGSNTPKDQTARAVAEPLPPASYDQEGLHQHLISTAWDEYGWEILKDILGNGAINNASHGREHTLFPTQNGPVEDRSHLSGHQVWDIGSDGAPLAVEAFGIDNESSKAMAIWHCIKDINPPSKDRKAVGRITIMRELSPILYGALHYTLSNTFDMDEIFKQLIVADGSTADVHRAFDLDARRQSSKIFIFQYFTIIGEDCKPMPWQLSSGEIDNNPKHIRITRCNSVVALALTGKPIRKVRNPSRRAQNQNEYGNIYDPWSSWHLLNLQCYPDLKSSTDVHDTQKHYVNGPEAFLVTLLGEFRDAQRRFEDINRAITKLITPSSSFMFDGNYRDDLLFEDEKFTYVRRYFWAYQTLGIMNESIRTIVDEFEHNFTDELWEGKDKTLWPIADSDSPRSMYYKKRMATLRQKFETQMKAFRKLINGNEERRTEIRGLREELYVGTSVKESRKSVEATETTVQQGHNIKLLTLVSIFFLPSQFVTSVFGMTNMPQTPSYWTFGVVLAAVCVPFFILIGSLNTNRGMTFWRNRFRKAFVRIMKLFSFLGRCFKKKDKSTPEGEEDEEKDESSRQPSQREPQPNSRRSMFARSPRSQDSGLSMEDGQLEYSPRVGRTPTSKLAELLKGKRRRASTTSTEV